VVVLVVVVVVAQTPSGHASHQLANALTNAVPPFGARARQAVSLRATSHEVVPPAVVRQQTTRPLRPQTERRAQRMTSALQERGSVRDATAWRTTRATQRT
jgi:hypothetical protein